MYLSDKFRLQSVVNADWLITRRHDYVTRVLTRLRDRLLPVCGCETASAKQLHYVSAVGVLSLLFSAVTLQLNFWRR